MTCHCGLEIEKWYIKEAIIPDIIDLINKGIQPIEAFESCSKFHKISVDSLKNEYEKHMDEINDN